jgi:hypothetical protein
VQIRMSKATPNFTRLDASRPDVAIIIAAMLAAREAVERRSSASPIQPTDDCWWADVLADPRARIRQRSHDRRPARERPYYTLADEPEATISVACTKCSWEAEFSRAELFARFGADYALPNLLEHLVAPDCSRRGDQWDRCGAYYVNPIGCSS